MMSHNYIEILNECFDPFVRECFPAGDFYLHQDNSPIHRSAEVVEYLKNNNVNWVNIL